jgi:acyl-CoA thioester hydrolase
MRPTFPTVEQIQQLPLLMRKQIPSEYLDINGHMNIQHYLGLYDEAGWDYFVELGMDEAYFTQQRNGVFDLEHHLHYLAEVHADDIVAIYGRLLARTNKRIHGMWFMVNETQGMLANTFEFVSTHADLDARSTSAFPEDIAGKVDTMIAEHQELEWKAPICGVMGA